MFNPMTDVPQTEEEAMIALQRDDEMLTGILQGLYRVLRAQGKSLLDAYRATLEEHVRAFTAEPLAVMGEEVQFEVGDG